MLSLVIFDCDGVLVDSERLSHEVLQQMLSELGVHLDFEQTVERFIGTSLPVCMARVAHLIAGPLPERFQHQFSARTRLRFEQDLRVVTGVEDVLDSLACAYCVASNGNRAKVDFTLGHTGLLARFNGRIFSADDVDRPKPAPDLFVFAARQMQALPSRTIVVEDTPTGVQAACAAGMRAIGFAAMTPGARLQAAGAYATATSMSEVQALLQAAADDQAGRNPSATIK